MTLLTRALGDEAKHGAVVAPANQVCAVTRAWRPLPSKLRDNYKRTMTMGCCLEPWRATRMRRLPGLSTGPLSLAMP